MSYRFITLYLFLFLNAVFCFSQKTDSVYVSTRLNKLLLLDKTDADKNQLYKCYDYNIPGGDDDYYLISENSVYHILESNDTLGCEMFFETRFRILNMFSRDYFVDSLGFTNEGLVILPASFDYDIIDTKLSDVISDCLQPDYYITRFVLLASYEKRVVAVDTFSVSTEKDHDIKKTITDNSSLYNSVKFVSFENNALFIVDMGVYTGERVLCVLSEDGVLHSVKISSILSVDRVVPLINDR